MNLYKVFGFIESAISRMGTHFADSDIPVSLKVTSLGSVGMSGSRYTNKLFDVQRVAKVQVL